MPYRGSSLHALLSDWPYARDYLLSTMDGELIEEHASLHLSRALNIGSVVAFLSAGVSMAYGRISWRQLVIELAEEAGKAYRDLKKAYKREPVPRRLVVLQRNLNRLRIGQPSRDEIKPDRYPSIFQLCAELSAAINSDEKYKGSSQQGFAERVKLRTRDGHFHAISLLARHLTGRDPLSQAVKTLARKWNNYVPAHRIELFKINNIIDYTFEKHPWVQDRLGELLDGARGEVSNSLKPSLRFLVPAVLQGCSI